MNVTAMSRCDTIPIRVTISKLSLRYSCSLAKLAHKFLMVILFKWLMSHLWHDCHIGRRFDTRLEPVTRQITIIKHEN